MSQTQTQNTAQSTAGAIEGATRAMEAAAQTINESLARFETAHSALEETVHTARDFISGKLASALSLMGSLASDLGADLLCPPSSNGTAAVQPAPKPELIPALPAPVAVVASESAPEVLPFAQEPEQVVTTAANRPVDPEPVPTRVADGLTPETGLPFSQIPAPRHTPESFLANVKMPPEASPTTDVPVEKSHCRPFDPALRIPIVADSIEQLRKVDVFRLLDNLSAEDRAAMDAYICTNRPDLSGAVQKAIRDLDLHGGTEPIQDAPASKGHPSPSMVVMPSPEPAPMPKPAPKRQVKASEYTPLVDAMNIALHVLKDVVAKADKALPDARKQVLGEAGAACRTALDALEAVEYGHWKGEAERQRAAGLMADARRLLASIQA